MPSDKNILLPMLAAFLLIGCAQEKPNPATLRPELGVVRIVSARDASKVAPGFLVSANGLVVTSDRLISDDTAVNVALSDGRSLPATFVAEDRDADVAILKIAGKDHPFFHLHTDDIEPIMHIRIAGPSGIEYGVFDHWEDSGQTLGLTALVTPADRGAPVVADDGTVIGVVRQSATLMNSPGIATPVWRVIRIMPTNVK